MSLPFALVERGGADSLFARRGSFHEPVSASETWLHEQLLDAAFDDSTQTVCRRRLAVSASGVPVVYSYKSPPRDRSNFRMLSEPGGTGITVAEQVQLSRTLINRVIDHFGWDDARMPTNAILDGLVPPDPEFYTLWHGGIGLGLETSARGPELRVYVNARHGDLPARWRRLTDAVREIADERAEPALREIVGVASPRAVPAGLGLAIDDRGVTAIRLYCGMTDASPAGVTAALPLVRAGAAPRIGAFLRSYAESFGPFVTQDITVAYDFMVRDGLLHPAVARYKADVYCEAVSRRDNDRLLSWLEGQLALRGLDASGLYRFINDVVDAFGGSTLQYASLGCSDRGDEVTVYCIPGDPARWAE